MPTTVTSTEEILAREWNRFEDETARLLATEMGPAPGQKKLSEADEVRLWNSRWPVDGAALVLLAEQAKQQAQQDPRVMEAAMQQVAGMLGQQFPEQAKATLMQHLAKGHYEDAQAVAEYPFREVLVNSGERRLKIGLRVDYANAMARKAAKARADDPSDPFPEVPTPGPLTAGPAPVGPFGEPRPTGTALSGGAPSGGASEIVPGPSPVRPLDDPTQQQGGFQG